MISSDSQRLTEFFLVQLQILHEISHRENTFGEIKCELNATNVK